MINLRKEFEKILKDYGHNIFLQRRNTQWESATPSYSSTLEKHTVRYTYPSSVSAANAKEEQKEGVTHRADFVYYFKHDANPQEGDRIYENLPGYPSEQTILLIDYVVAMRGSRGEICYWVAGVTREEPS